MTLFAVFCFLFSAHMNTVVPNALIKPPPQRRALIRMVRDKVAEVFNQPKAESYQGRMLGVYCRCTLHRAEKYAELSLDGVPIGGHLEGTARFKPDGKGVVLDPALEKAVAKRLTTVYQAVYRAKDDTVHIVLSVPIFGLRRMVLSRSE